MFVPSFKKRTKIRSCILDRPTELEDDDDYRRACDRRSISNRAGAQLASALLQDLNLISPENQAAVIDKFKIFRKRLKNRRCINSTHSNEIIALYFDGRKDETIIKEIVRGKSVCKTIQEEHISLVEEPVSAYFGHVTPNSGSGKDIVFLILSYMSDNSKIKALGCDGSTMIGGAPQDISSIQSQQENSNSLQQLLQQREEETRQEIERLTAEIRALKLQLLQYTNKISSNPTALSC
ncbi:unnamed protein product [Diabrotica balteata]|uniref:Uncharacterized protein n=1 Tax=Diabrotica balteata TaxID=107213 RepID=A0A9N9XGA4_DIABA|nr:unnamed protein product [Diabrotica balteata]